jgi:hypothetical protein
MGSDRTVHVVTGSSATPAHTLCNTLSNSHTSPPLHPCPHAPLTLTILQTAKIHLKPAGQKVRVNGTASLTAKVIGADGRPVAGRTITFATGATVAAATANLIATSPAPVTATTDATGHATASLTMATAGKFVAVAGMPTGTTGPANQVVSGAAHIVVRA